VSPNYYFVNSIWGKWMAISEISEAKTNYGYKYKLHFRLLPSPIAAPLKNREFTNVLRRRRQLNKLFEINRE
jgi:hypothetical protein